MQSVFASAERPTSHRGLSYALVNYREEMLLDVPMAKLFLFIQVRYGVLGLGFVAEA
jgi:hypothetical protein